MTVGRNISVLAERWRALTSTQRWNVAAAINGYRADALRIGQNVDGYDLAKEILEAAAEPDVKDDGYPVGCGDVDRLALLGGDYPMPQCSHPDVRRDERGTQCRICGERIGDYR